MTDNTIHPQIIRHGLTELLNLPAGVRDAITHIGLSTARFAPTAETSSVPDEVLRIAISDAIDAGDNAIQFYAAIGDGEWTGNMTAIYTVAFYLSTGTLLAVWSNPNEVEALLRKGRNEEFYYTFALDALPADKIEIISTERVFNPGIKEAVNALTTDVGDIQSQLANAETDIAALKSGDDSLAVASIRQTLALDSHDRDLQSHDNKISSLRGELLTAHKSIKELEVNNNKFERAIEDLAIAQYSSHLQNARLVDDLFNDGFLPVKMQPEWDDGYQTYLGYDTITKLNKQDHTHENYGFSADKTGTFGQAELRVKAHGAVFDTRHIDNLGVEPIPGSTFGTRSINHGVIPSAIKTLMDAGDTAGAIAEFGEWYRAFVNKDRNHRPYDLHCSVLLTVMDVFAVKGDMANLSASFRHQPDEADLHDVTMSSAFFKSDSVGLHPRFQNKNHPVISASVDNKNKSTPQLFKIDWRMAAVKLGTLRDINPDDCLYFDYDPIAASRLGLSRAEMENHVAAQFAVKQVITTDDSIPNGRITAPVLLDDWMSKYPALSGGEYIPVYIDENGKTYQMIDATTNEPLNGGRPFRFFKLPADDATGLDVQHVGWKGTSSWRSYTNDPAIIPLIDPITRREHRVVTSLPKDVAIYPFWLNPELNIWGIPYKETVTGKGTKAHPYDGWNENGYFYLLPNEIFSAGENEDNPANTRRKAWMLDKDGIPRLCVAAGFTIFSHPIDGKTTRMRWDIGFDAYRGNYLYRQLTAYNKRFENEKSQLAMASIRQTLATDDAIKKQTATDNKIGQINGLLETLITGVKTNADAINVNSLDIHSLTDVSIRQTLTIDGDKKYDY